MYRVEDAEDDDGGDRTVMSIVGVGFLKPPLPISLFSPYER